MDKKKDLRRLLICIACCMGLVMIWTVIIDPFHHYHAPWFNIPLILEDEVYQTPGNATNLEYSSAIVGTSMTENFRVSWFEEELGWDMMKLCYAGASSGDLQALLECVYANSRQVEHIVMDLNDYQLTEELGATYVERPKYLYSKTLLDDYRYIYNHDVFTLGAERVLAGLQGKESNIETAFTWEEEELFGKEIVLEGHRPAKEMLLEKNKEQKSVEKDSIDEAVKLCEANLNQIIPFIKEHPETKYIVYLPPYSMLYWEQIVLEDKLEEKMAVYKYAVEQLIGLENVEFYYFQGEDMTENLDEYRDITHHKPKYNRYIFECMKDGKNRLTYDNYEEELQKVYNKAKSYAYEVLWQ